LTATEGASTRSSGTSPGSTSSPARTITDWSSPSPSPNESLSTWWHPTGLIFFRQNFCPECPIRKLFRVPEMEHCFTQVWAYPYLFPIRSHSKNTWHLFWPTIESPPSPMTLLTFGDIALYPAPSCDVTFLFSQMCTWKQCDFRPIKKLTYSGSRKTDSTSYCNQIRTILPKWHTKSPGYVNVPVFLSLLNYDYLFLSFADLERAVETHGCTFTCHCGTAYELLTIQVRLRFHQVTIKTCFTVNQI